MTKLILAAAFLALGIGAASANCPGHTVTAQTGTATVADGSTPLPITPKPESNTGG